MQTYSCFPRGSDGKESPCNVGDQGLIPRLGIFLGEGNGNPLQYSCLENFMDREAWWARVHGVAKSQTQLSDYHFLTQLIHIVQQKLTQHCKTIILQLKILFKKTTHPEKGQAVISHIFTFVFPTVVSFMSLSAVQSLGPLQTAIVRGCHGVLATLQTLAGLCGVRPPNPGLRHLSEAEISGSSVPTGSCLLSIAH